MLVGYVFTSPTLFSTLTETVEELFLSTISNKMCNHISLN